ncbi:hypothetical protein RCL1_004565 [Eukaryota sp. TZLM3-RCL]
MLSTVPVVRLSRFEILSKVDEGTFGVIFHAFDRVLNSRIVLKELKFLSDVNDVSSPHYREIHILSLLDHINICPLLFIVEPPDFFRGVFLGLPLYDYDLLDFINYQNKVSQKVPLTVVKFISHQILSGLNYLHSLNLIHRDLKPSNIFIKAFEGNIVLGDFGSSSFLSNSSQTPGVVTLNYRAPELLLGDLLYNNKVDIFSFGCIVYELVMGEPLFKATSELLMLSETVEKLGLLDVQKWPELSSNAAFSSLQFAHGETGTLWSLLKRLNIDEDLVAFLQACLELSPCLRASPQDLLNHSFLSDVPADSSVFRIKPDEIKFVKTHHATDFS